MKKLLLPALSGAMLALSFPKLDLAIFAWFALIPLLVSIGGDRPRGAFVKGFACGVVFYLASVYWVINTMHKYGGLPLAVSLLLLAALACYMALYVGAFAAAVSFVRVRTAIPLALTAPAIWVALELARNYLVTGFPWNLLGYSQYGFLPVIQIAEFTGVYGVSALVVMANAAIAGLVIRKMREGSLAARDFIPAAASAAVIVAALAFGSYRLSHPPTESGRIKAALVQGNIEQFHKWDPEFQDEVFNTYKQLSLKAAASRPDIIIWPETATPFYFQDVDNNPKLLAAAKEAGTFIMTGSPSVEERPDGSLIEYNSAYLISPDGALAGRYDKMHLVPFGEYVPAKKLLPFVSRMVTSIGDFGSGTEYTVLDAGKGATFGTAICFEAIFPELVRKFPAGGATFLTTITNDAWFGDSAAPYQHFNMAAFRAVENRRAMVRVANTGISGIVLPTGKVASRTKLFEAAVLTGEVPLVRELTFYTRYGDVFAYLCALASGAFLLISLRAGVRG